MPFPCRAGVAMMFVTNANLKSEIGGTTKTYSNAVSEAWRYLGNVKKVIESLKVLSCNYLDDEVGFQDSLLWGREGGCPLVLLLGV